MYPQDALNIQGAFDRKMPTIKRYIADAIKNKE
jgi:hypothetical protein